MDAMSNAIVSADFMQKLEAQKSGAVARPEEPPRTKAPEAAPTAPSTKGPTV
jgi:hypothetical protein